MRNVPQCPDKVCYTLGWNYWKQTTAFQISSLIRQVRGRSRKKKPASGFKVWLTGALTDLVVGILLLIISKLLE